MKPLKPSSLEPSPLAPGAYHRKGGASALILPALILVVVLIVLLRLVCLDSDAYPRLSWSTALLTDEGFYLHNSRNLVLFGQERLDGFNNMLIMPLLHLIQIGVFRVFGVGMFQTRMISVVCSLLALAFFWDGLRRVWGRSVALLGLIFLGLDHVNLLYNRLGLMDTPCTLFLIGGWWAYVQSLYCTTITADMESAEIESAARAASAPGLRFDRRARWLLACGLIFGAAYTVRGLAALIWLVPLAVPFLVRPNRTSLTFQGWALSCLYFAVGLTAALFAYLVLWWLPNRQELAFVNHYYIRHQLLPHGARQFDHNLHVAFLDWAEGLFPYLFKHTPVQLALAVVWVVLECRGILLARRRARNEDGVPTLLQRSSATFFLCWLLIFLTFCCCVNYSPSRYYVMFYPPLAGLAALGVRDLTALLPANRRIGWMIGCLVVCAWAVINGFWLIDWARHITYRQRDTDRWLATHLPPHSTLLGSVALGLTMNNRFRAVNMIADLCNDDRPVERAQSPKFIVIIDDERPVIHLPRKRQPKSWKERWWIRHYPDLVAPQHRKYVFRGLLRTFFVVGVYPAERTASGQNEEFVPDSEPK